MVRIALTTFIQRSEGLQLQQKTLNGNTTLLASQTPLATRKSAEAVEAQLKMVFQYLRELLPDRDRFLLISEVLQQALAQLSRIKVNFHVKQQLALQWFAPKQFAPQQFLLRQFAPSHDA